MAISRRWIELEDECFGPDRKGNYWEMFLIIYHCSSYIAHKKTGAITVTRRKKAVISLVAQLKRDVLQKLNTFVNRKDVTLLV